MSDFILLGPDGEPDHVLHAEYEAKAIERGSGMTDIKAISARDAMSGYLWALHEAAQDAANDPTSESVRGVKKAMRKVTDALPMFYTEYTRLLTEQAKRAGQ